MRIERKSKLPFYLDSFNQFVYIYSLAVKISLFIVHDRMLESIRQQKSQKLKKVTREHKKEKLLFSN